MPQPWEQADGAKDYHIDISSTEVGFEPVVTPQIPLAFSSSDGEKQIVVAEACGSKVRH